MKPLVKPLVLLVAVLSFGCGSDEGSDPDASPPDAASLTIGDVCAAISPTVCQRDAECFDFFEPPCDQSFLAFCCGDDDICDDINGVEQAQVDVCIEALEEATCAEIENNFPAECREITLPPAAAGRLRSFGASAPWRI